MNFSNTDAEIQQKYEREREKVGERKCMNFGNVITKIPVVRRNQLWQYHCRNRGRKKNFVAIVAMHCRNRGRKKNSGY